MITGDLRSGVRRRGELKRGYGATLVLYESCARAEEILALDVEDLILADKQAVSSQRAARPSGSTGNPAPRSCGRAAVLAQAR
jgi:hypothetical protein